MEKKKRGITRKVAAALLVALFGVLLGGCGTTVNTTEYSSLEDFEGSTLGMLSGGTLDTIVEEAIGDVSFKSYPDLTGEISALNKGDVDGIIQDISVANDLVAQHPEFAVFPKTVASVSFGFALEKDSPYTEEFTEAIRDLYADGTIVELQEKWFSGDEDRMAIDWEQYDTSDRGNGTLVCAYDYTKEPLSYQGDDGEVCGYEPEVLLNIADRLDLGITFEGATFGALISYVETGKANVSCGGISITEERAEAVDFPESHYHGAVAIVCRGENLAVDASGESGESGNFWQRAADSFVKTFIRDARWRTIGSGLLVTVEITVLAALFGTFLGFGMCLLRRVKNRIVSTVARVFCRIINGIPAVVLLLVVYFVIFASSPIGAVAVAVIVFTVLFTVSVGGILNRTINEMDHGQWGDASTLGLHGNETFWDVIMPRAIRETLPAYRSELISLLKSTSIVGYIAIMDLTKAADAIRARTYEAFLPLITTAVIYLLIAVLINVIMRRIITHIHTREQSALPQNVAEREEAARVFQELVMGNILPHCGERPDVNVAVGYEEGTEEITMRFVWRGERFNPFVDGDPLTIKEIRGFVKSEEYAYEDGENRLCVVL